MNVVLTQAIKAIITKAANLVRHWVELAHTSEQYVLVVLEVWQPVIQRAVAWISVAVDANTANVAHNSQTLTDRNDSYVALT